MQISKIRVMQGIQRNLLSGHALCCSRVTTILLIPKSVPVSVNMKCKLYMVLSGILEPLLSLG